MADATVLPSFNGGDQAFEGGRFGLLFKLMAMSHGHPLWGAMDELD